MFYYVQLMLSFLFRYSVWTAWISVSVILIFRQIWTFYCFPSSTLDSIIIYGKGNENEKNRKLTFEVPKRWFGHFYIFACIYHTVLAWSLWRVYFQRNPPSIFLNTLVKLFLNSGRPPTVVPEAVIIVMVLILFQVYRRCYECYFVSVYSNSKMSISHYIIGYCFYFGVGLSLLSEAPGFTKPGGLKDIKFTQSWLKINHLIGIILFLFGWWFQFQSHKILANLRKDDKGKMTTMKHTCPKGGLFEYVTNPHYFCEIIIYLALQVILGYRNVTWWLLCLWVVTCHIVMATISHNWYEKKFPQYAVTRKALIPHLL